MLAELVHDPYASLEEVTATLASDPRVDQLTTLRNRDKEDVIERHQRRLLEKRKAAFTALLDETDGIELSTPFAAVAEWLKTAPGFLRYGRDARERHAAFETYLEERTERAKKDFQKLLKELKCITHRSYGEVKTAGLDAAHMKEILQALEHDKRYHVLEFAPEVRVELLFDYLKELEQRGAPPPPTATSKPTEQ
eukprot:m.83047 g.83047  ORF g.83047 m.83047 type:complete len:195 (+) comp14644_c0_seq1:922-1506(+)